MLSGRWCSLKEASFKIYQLKYQNIDVTYRNTELDIQSKETDYHQELEN